MMMISAKQILIALGGILATLGALYTLDSYIDSKVQSKVNDPDFRAALASSIRPSLIFDSKETILIDAGALQYIDSIIVTARLSEFPLAPTSILVKPKKYLTHAPLLSSLDQYNFNITVTRGKGIDWIFDLDLISHSDFKVPPRFRLEVLQ